MEKPKAKNKLLKLIPKAAQAMAISFSPRRDNRADAHRPRNKAFSGPIAPMIPAEARRKPKNFENQEPTSPKVSCMGQIKHKKKINSKKKKKKKPDSLPLREKARPAGPVKGSGIRNMLRRKADESAPSSGAEPASGAPSLSQMRKFASSRDTFANFDWTAAQVAPDDDRGFYSEGDVGYSDGEDDVIIPLSAPILISGGGGGEVLDLEPRKEINLWKRRTLTQPPPLHLKLDIHN